MDFLLPPRPARGSSDQELVLWAKACLQVVLADLEAIRSCSGIFYHRDGQEPIDLTPGMVARLERHAKRLSAFINAKPSPAERQARSSCRDEGLRRAG